MIGSYRMDVVWRCLRFVGYTIRCCWVSVSFDIVCIVVAMYTRRAERKIFFVFAMFFFF